MDNMMNYLNERKSIRNFKLDPISNDLESNILSAIREIEENDQHASARFDYFRDGERIFQALDGLAGYGGVMIKAPSYVALEYMKDSKADAIYSAFMMEELITRIRDLGLSTCWITLGVHTKEAKRELFGEVGDNIDYLLAIGHAEAKKPFEKIPESYRKPVDEIVFLDDSWHDSAKEKLRELNMLDLFAALRFSPSHGNSQPWRFTVQDDRVTIYLSKKADPKTSITDAGIIMFYFKELVHKMGIDGEWEVDPQAGEDYDKIASFKI